MTISPTAAPRRPFRLWMTGSLAVVMAALTTVRLPLEDEAERSRPTVRHSRHDLNETVLRIEAAARQRGQSVLVRMGGEQPVLVLASSVGGTPVWMAQADSQPDMPMVVRLRATADGGTDLVLSAPPSASLLELPPTVIAEIVALPALLDRALA